MVRYAVVSIVYHTARFGPFPLWAALAPILAAFTKPFRPSLAFFLSFYVPNVRRSQNGLDSLDAFLSAGPAYGAFGELVMSSDRLCVHVADELGEMLSVVAADAKNDLGLHV